MSVIGRTGVPRGQEAAAGPGRSIALAICLCAATAFAAPARAADPEAPDPRAISAELSADPAELEEVVVTANKRKENIQAIPYSVAALNGETILARGVRDAQDIANLIPNFNAQGSGRAGPRWFLRGIGDANPNDVTPLAIHLDDVYINYNGSTNFPLYDIERVEVLKGPQGTLWGKNTTAGAVNIIARKPEFAPGNGYLDLRYGDFGARQLEAAVGQVLVDDKLAGRLAIHVDSSNGYAKDRVDGSSVGAYTNFNSRGSLLFRPNDELDLLVQAHYDRLTNPGANNVIQARTSTGSYVYQGQTVNLLPYGSNPDLFDAVGPQNSDLEFYGGTVRATQALADLTLISITAFEKSSMLANTIGTPIPVANILSRTALKDEQISQEFRLASDESDPRYNWQAGLFYFNGRQVAAIAGDQLVAPTLYRLTNYAVKTETYAVFLSSTVTPLPETLPEFRILLGGRETKDKRSIHLQQYYGTGGTYLNPGLYYTPGIYPAASLAATQNNSNTWDAFTYDVTPQWDITPDIHAYVRYAKGFRGGYYNTNPTGATPDAIRASLSVISPETLYEYEGGLKTQWWGRQLTLNLAVFNDDLQNYYTNVLSVLNGQTVSTTTNVGTGFSRGIEIESRLQPNAIEGLILEENLGLLETRIEKSRYANLVGAQLVRSPHFSATTSVQYAYSLPGIGGAVRLNTDWKYTTGFYYTIAAETNQFRQHAQLIGNGEIAYVHESGQWSLGLYARNITDRRFPTTIIGSAALAQVYQGEPRAFGGFVRADF